VAEIAAVPEGGRALDLATGTGGVAFALARRTPSARIDGIDFCEPMIVAAQAQAAARTGFASGLEAVPAFVVGDALHLRYATGGFDAVTISFGMRNLADLPAGLREMWRVLKPGGRLVCLELTHVQQAFIRVPFDVYFFHLAPLLGAALSGDRDAYTYLPHSLTSFPNADILGLMMADAGFRSVRYRLLNFGTIAIHLAVK
jgi:demethylmenaquinone methyltransferase/2-methoxy-6-polyprenyl-1,4-benzoquinol methylase